jgi:hypothetical protein
MPARRGRESSLAEAGPPLGTGLRGVTGRYRFFFSGFDPQSLLKPVSVGLGFQIAREVVVLAKMKSGNGHPARGTRVYPESPARV